MKQSHQNGSAVYKPLYLGAYFLCEISVPDEVILDRTEEHFELVYKDQNTPIVNLDMPIEKKLRKSDKSYIQADRGRSVRQNSDTGS